MSEAKGFPDQPVRCLHCQSPLESPVGCLHCHSIFPSSSGLSHFDRLGLPSTFDLDRRELDRRYLAWSRELHPDYFQTKSAAEQSQSLTLSASLNDAYSTLRDPFRRAEYLLHQLGGPSASEHRGMPEGFLEGVLELRMAIEESRREENAAALQKLREQVEADRRAAMEEVAAQFRAIGGTADFPSVEGARLATIRESLNTVKYYDGLLRELDGV